LKKAEKLEFAAWGGFAQNYAGRRIPFEHASSTPVYERARAENLFIPTFSSGPRGPYLPASALKGALRTALVNTRANPQVLKEASGRLGSDGRGMRQVGIAVEDAAVGPGGSNAMRQISLADSGSRAARESMNWVGSRLRVVRPSEPRMERRCLLKWRCPAPPSRASGMRSAS
jgi:CRISPR-associated protein Csm5